jgi:membrane fusion protein, copper/silver efflux system
MRKNWKNNWMIFLIAATLALTSCGKGDHSEHADTYTCPMHPTVISDRQGTCPVCGMNLVRKARPGEEVEITEDLAKLIKSPNETVVSSVKTIKGEYKSVPVSIAVQGVVTYDSRNIYTIPSRVGGRLEKIFLKYEFQSISKGIKIAEIYSPELITAQRELLFLLENDAENSTLINAAKNKLELLGMSPGQIDNLIKKKEVANTFAVYSPYNGYLISNEQSSNATSITSVTASNAGAMSDNMGATSSNNSSASMPALSNASTFIKEGSYVSPGQTLFRIVDNSMLRIELDLPTEQVGAIKIGDKLELHFDGNKENATVDFVQPLFNKGQDFLKLRVYAKKIEHLHIGQLVNGRIILSPSESLWIPREAVINLGNDKIVFAKDKGVLKPKKVSTGISSESLIEIKSGLASSDEIAANAQYLVDSESFIKAVK